MGRWQGLHLLQLGNLDVYTHEQREQQITAKLRDWFDPEHTKRPAFDANETIWELVAAVTPRFSARVLIPSDQLSPEHRPVERLSVETSGGEGVTFALILASLLASRRARGNGHKRTTLLLDNPFSKVTKPSFLRLARDIASSLGVQLVALTGIKDAEALTVFPRLIEMRVSRRTTSNVVVPEEIDDERLDQLLHEGTLFVSSTERDALQAGDEATWPAISIADVCVSDQLSLLDDPAPDGEDADA
jgi:hypothetical protein